MAWGDPGWFRILWLLPAAALLAWYDLRRRRRRRERLVAAGLLPVLAPSFDARRERRAALAWVCGLTLLGLALPRPQWGYTLETVTSRGLDIVVALDTSRSMLAADYRPNRLQAARWGLLDFVSRLEGDRVALLVFEGSHYLLCPLTSDYAAFRMTLDDVYAGMVPRGGTAIEQALRGALTVFPEESEADRVILLVSDGEDHEGNPMRLLPDLRERGIRILIVGMGTAEGSLVPVEDEQAGFLRDGRGRMVVSRLDEDLLRGLARAADGLYVRATPDDFGARVLVESGLAGLRRAEAEESEQRVPTERFPWFLGAAFACLLIESILGTRRLRRVPGPSAPERIVSSAPPPPGRHVSRIAVCLLAALSMASAPKTDPRGAMREGRQAYQEEVFEQAAEAFGRAAEGAVQRGWDPSPAHMNRGHAHYHAGRFEKAAKAYLEAARTEDLERQARAYYNAGTARAAHGAELRAAGRSRPALDALRKALDHLDTSLALSPDNEDALGNRDWIQAMLEEIGEEENDDEEGPPAVDEEAGDPEDGPDGPPQEPSPERLPGPEERPEKEPDPAGQDMPAEEWPPSFPPDTPPDPAVPDTDEPPDPDRPPTEAGDIPPEEALPMAETTDIPEDEARGVLDALREQEEAQRREIRLRLGPPERVEKDW